MCSCEADFDRPKFYVTTWRTARKPHCCYECERAIQPKERYQHLAICDEGGVDTYAICEACERWSEAFMAAQRIACGCSGYELGQLWSAMDEFREEHMGSAGVIPMVPMRDRFQRVPAGTTSEVQA